MTGDELAKELIAVRPDIPIILCTGFNHRIDDEKAERLGIKAFLMKPISMDVPAETINQVLSQK